MRYRQQQVNHIASPVQIQTIGYCPPSCMFETFPNATINACDSHHGEFDGFVARSDLCSLKFNFHAWRNILLCWQLNQELGPRLWKSKTTGFLHDPEQKGNFTADNIKVLEDLMSALRDVHVTSGDLEEWTVYVIDKCMDWLQNTLPDLSSFLEKGGRPMHFRGEAGTRNPPQG
ncbi:putative Carboxylic ester hydrolase [Seiridium cardinale]|uniref:feruloyl esterase n=1 Tax=Seiridium cardinale TaxID=138064 RepID=A0ABR2Y2G5_9PEZI